MPACSPLKQRGSPLLVTNCMVQRRGKQTNPVPNCSTLVIPKFRRVFSQFKSSCLSSLENHLISLLLFSFLFSFFPAMSQFTKFQGGGHIAGLPYLDSPMLTVLSRMWSKWLSLWYGGSCDEVLLKVIFGGKKVPGNKARQVLQ